MQAIQSRQQNDGWLQSSVRTLGSHAQTSTPAYALTALFALSTPFGFASPAQAAAEAAAKLQHQQRLAKVSEAASSRGSSGLVARLVANVQSQRAASAQTQAPVRTLPPFWQLAFFAAAFGTGGYMIDQGDALNGSGVVTAWSLTYLLFKTLPSVRELPRNPLAFSLSAAVLTIGLGVHGSHYFDRTSWRGAIPTMTGSNDKADASSRSRFVTFDTVGSTNATAAPTSIFAKNTPSSPIAPEQVASAISSESGHKRASANNNDDARAAAFLHRQGGAGSVRIIP